MKLLWFFIFSLILNNYIFSKEYVVCSNCEVSSIQEAINQADNKDTIYVEFGIYKESITIDKEIKLIGKGHPIIDNTFTGHGVLITADNAQIESFIIKNIKHSDLDDFAAIYVQEANHCHITNNVLLEATYGIFLEKVNHCTISHNYSVGNLKRDILSGDAYHVWSSHYINIHHNISFQHRDGIYLEFSTNLEIYQNKILKNTRYGMHFMYCNYNQFYNNIFQDNFTGIAIMYSEYIEMHHNKIFNTGQRISRGMLFKQINYSKFYNNLIQKSSTGLVLDGAEGNSFINNIFADNGYALHVYGNSVRNVFAKNNMINNFFDVITKTKDSKNTFEGNYWSKYVGYDLDKDLVGDESFNPVNAFSYYISSYPELVVLLHSPIIKILDKIEMAFPIFRPMNLTDTKPALKPLEININ